MTTINEMEWTDTQRLFQRTIEKLEKIEGSRFPLSDKTDDKRLYLNLDLNLIALAKNNINHALQMSLNNYPVS